MAVAAAKDVDDHLAWYDSSWLAKYLAAKDVLARIAPSRLPEFIDSFRPLRTPTSFTVSEVPGVFDAAMLTKIRNEVRSLPITTMEMHEIQRFGRFVVHDQPMFNELQRALVDRVSDLVGEPVEPSYNFLCLYTRSGICEPHLDAPSAKWTLDACIDQSDPWPIYFSQVVPWPENRPSWGDDWQSKIKTSPQLTFEAKVLTPGDGIVFSGSSQWHYRDAMPQSSQRSFCDLLFFHFIPKGMAELVDTRNWARIFGVPELNLIPGIAERS